MAYFSNSSDGSVLDEMCSKCAHLGPEDGPGCPVLLLQLMWNYEQHGETAEAKAKKYALDNLIPQDRAVMETSCSMFVPLAWLNDKGKFEVGQADQAMKERVKLEEWNKLYGPNKEAVG